MTNANTAAPSRITAARAPELSCAWIAAAGRAGARVGAAVGVGAGSGAWDRLDPGWSGYASQSCFGLGFCAARAADGVAAEPVNSISASTTATRGPALVSTARSSLNHHRRHLDVVLGFSPAHGRWRSLA